MGDKLERILSLGTNVLKSCRLDVSKAELEISVFENLLVAKTRSSGIGPPPIDASTGVTVTLEITIQSIAGASMVAQNQMISFLKTFK